jgi:hypothetical protein
MHGDPTARSNLLVDHDLDGPNRDRLIRLPRHHDRQIVDPQIEHDRASGRIRAARSSVRLEHRRRHGHPEHTDACTRDRRIGDRFGPGTPCRSSKQPDLHEPCDVRVDDLVLDRTSLLRELAAIAEP